MVVIRYKLMQEMRNKIRNNWNCPVHSLRVNYCWQINIPFPAAKCQPNCTKYYAIGANVAVNNRWM